MTLLLPAVAAGLIAVAVTRLIERFGGVIGGLLGTLPTTIVPAAIAIWWASGATSQFRDAMGAVPVGMAVDGVFLYAWRVLPPVLPGSDRSRLLGTTLLSLTTWGLLALGATLGMSMLRDLGIPPLIVGVVAFGLLELGGIWACRSRVPAPTGSQPVGPATLAARAVLAGVAIAVAGGLAESGIPLMAGMASVFPAIFLTTMVSLWWSQGVAVPTGAVGPMILGSGAVSAFALAAAITLPSMGVVVGSLVAWALAAGLVTLPAWAFLRSRTG